MKNFYIAGASSRSRTARVYLEYLNADMKISAFLVSPEMTDNDPVVDGVPVLPITSSLHQEAADKGIQAQMRGCSLDTSLPVYLGTRGINHPKLEAELRAIGFTDIIPVDMQLDSELRNAYLTKYYASNGREFVRMDMLPASSDTSSLTSLSSTVSGSNLLSTGLGSSDNCEASSGYNDVDRALDAKLAETMPIETTEKVTGGGESEKTKVPTATIYVASSVFDGELKDEYHPIPEEHKIQVGCALTEERLDGCNIFDNTGENISDLNKNFCELTGLYWIWKNATEDYVGLAHYRRHFLLPNNWIEICRENGVDAILPVPLYVNPSVSENYRERHVASDWDYLMEYFKKNLPEEYEDIVRILGGNLYCPCNMIIARRQVLDELCRWMFPIIFNVFEHGEKCGLKRDPYQSRFPGFISERLITYYFESRRDRYKVVYCNKNFLNCESNK